MSETYTTSVPAPTFGPNGFIAPPESAVLAGVQADVDNAFGGGLNPALETPQGQIASSLTAIIGDANDQFLALANGVDPAYAAGRMQDAIGRIYFITRNPALATTVPALCVGLPGTVIPTGALAQATDGSIYVCTGGGTIPQGGSISLQFQCQKTGPIACPSGSLNGIYKAIPGWDTISNPTGTDTNPAFLGQNVESRADFEFRRQNSVAKNAVGSLAAILGSILDVPNVLDAYVTDNSSPNPITVGGVTIPAWTLYCCVSGGDALAVATAIWKKKAPGTPMMGNVTETVYDTNSGYSQPYPAYQISFTTPTDTALAIAVNMKNSAQVPTDALSLIQAAAQAAFTGADNGPRARIGSTLYASRFYAGVAALGPWAQIVSIKIGLQSAGAPASDELTMNINQRPTLDNANIALNLV